MNWVVEQVEPIVGRLLELAANDHRVIDVDDHLLTLRQHEQRIS